jgi:hypothetical protein
MPAAAKLNQATILGNADKGFAADAVLAEMNVVPQNRCCFGLRTRDKRFDDGRPHKPACRARP